MRPPLSPPPRVQILVIAVLMKSVMKRTFNVFQWEALLLLVAGITGLRGYEQSAGCGVELSSAGLPLVFTQFTQCAHSSHSVHTSTPSNLP